jgi:hypothetical protein
MSHATTGARSCFLAIFILVISMAYDFCFAIGNAIFHLGTACIVPRSTQFYDAKDFFAS